MNTQLYHLQLFLLSSPLMAYWGLFPNLCPLKILNAWRRSMLKRQRTVSRQASMELRYSKQHLQSRHGRSQCWLHGAAAAVRTAICQSNFFIPTSIGEMTSMGALLRTAIALSSKYVKPSLGLLGRIVSVFGFPRMAFSMKREEVIELNNGRCYVGISKALDGHTFISWSLVMMK